MRSFLSILEIELCQCWPPCSRFLLHRYGKIRFPKSILGKLNIEDLVIEGTWKGDKVMMKDLNRNGDCLFEIETELEILTATTAQAQPKRQIMSNDIPKQILSNVALISSSVSKQVSGRAALVSEALGIKRTPQWKGNVVEIPIFKRSLLPSYLKDSNIRCWQFSMTDGSMIPGENNKG